jgi:hypothetical protein
MRCTSLSASPSRDRLLARSLSPPASLFYAPGAAHHCCALSLLWYYAPPELRVGRHSRRSTALPLLVHLYSNSSHFSSLSSAQTAMVDWNSPAVLAKDERTSARRRLVDDHADAAAAQASPSWSLTSPLACTCGSSSSRSTLSGNSSRASASSAGRWYVLTSRLCLSRAREEAAADVSHACRSSTLADGTACWPR